MASTSSSALRSAAHRAERQLHVPPHSASSSSSSSYSRGMGAQLNQSVRSRASASRRSVTPNSRARSGDLDEDSVRVRVAVRLRPRNTEDLLSDADFADCVELQPELKRLKLRKNNWSSESYRFDEIFTETASQKRVYDVVAKPVVEGVLNGYNGTVMAYGQTGTGKTYTVGRLGKEDASERGIMVRALEDVLASTSDAADSVEVSYLQLYMECIQDLLSPEKINIPIVEDPKNGEVTLPGAAVVNVRDLEHFIQLLQVGEANRHAANTKLNAESSRSHAILMVYVRKSVRERVMDDAISREDSTTDITLGSGIPLVRRSKLLIVDLAGSERIDKSGSEGHLLEEAKFINLSLSALGKCINALAENSPHIPIRDSKLTRLLRDSFGGSARTSLIITIGPSARHHAETTSTIMFGQRAMKVVNMVKLKEEFDYESLCRKLEKQVDVLTAEIERQLRLRDNDKCEMEKRLKECEISLSEAEENLLTRSEILEREKGRLQLEMEQVLTELNRQKDHNNLMHDKVADLEMSLNRSKQQQLENSSYQKVLADTTQMYEKKISDLIKQLDEERTCSINTEAQLHATRKLLCDCQKSNEQYQIENSACQKKLADTTQMYEEKIVELNKQLEDEHAHLETVKEQLDLERKLQTDHQNSVQTQDQKEIDDMWVKLQKTYELQENTIKELETLRSEYEDVLSEKVNLSEELRAVRQRLLAEEKKRKIVENELIKIQRNVPENDSDFEDKRSYMKENIGKESPAFGNVTSHKSNPLRETLSGQRATITKICEEVGLQKILQLLSSRDSDVQIHAVKVVANLAAEDTNQAKIVEEGGLDALLMLLRTSENTTILRVASGAIANLAMNEMNQGLIMSKGGARLLAKTASKTDDPQTLRMVAGALANLCGNEKLHLMLKEDGGIKAMMGMVKSGNIDVIAQVARGIANFAKCESRAIIQERRKGRSLLMDDDTLTWLIANSSTTSISTRRHIELALCHLAQNEENARDFMSSGGLKEVIRVSVESSREDIRNLAKKTLKLKAFQAKFAE